MMRILVAEDDAVSQKVLAKLLLPFGKVDCASDGQEAIEAIRRAHQQKQRYDLVCLDLMMPHHSGLEVLQTLREIEAGEGVEESAETCALMITSTDDKEMFIKAVTSGSQWYVTKPVERVKLYEILADLGFEPNNSEG